MSLYGKQLFQLSADVHINFEDKGGLMGFQLLPIEPGDEDIYDVFTITSPLKWTPHKFVLNRSLIKTVYNILIVNYILIKIIS